tara:strand:+ start:5426 stop:6508 length:1083 start_codon:yes stop_codon:yes gene_type:complete
MQNDKQIAYILGTKAQFIKSKFILKYLIDEGYELTVLDTGQHRLITKKELELFNKKYSYFNLVESNKNISSISAMIVWFFKIIFFKNVSFKNKDIKYCLVHGDTVSTLLGLIIAKRNKLNIIHIEAGYKSNNWFKPFPEEIIRSIVSKYSNIVSVDNEECFKNIRNKKDKKFIRLQKNTIYDAVLNSLEKVVLDKKNTLTVTVHRTENIYDKKQLKKFVDLLISISDLNLFESINWYCHDITKSAIEKYNYEKKLIENKINLNALIPHSEFVNVLINSKCVITDGGSIAEECSIMNQNTIIWRDVIENFNYLNDRVLLSKYNKENIINFLKNLDTSYPNLNNDYSPSKDFVNQLMEIDKA